MLAELKNNKKKNYSCSYTSIPEETVTSTWRNGDKKIKVMRKTIEIEGMLRKEAHISDRCPVFSDV